MTNQDKVKAVYESAEAIKLDIGLWRIIFTDGEHYPALSNWYDKEEQAWEDAAERIKTTHYGIGDGII